VAPAGGARGDFEFFLRELSGLCGKEKFSLFFWTLFLFTAIKKDETTRKRLMVCIFAPNEA
jgi:hypothetical protein